MKKLSGTLLAILLAALLGMGVMAFTTAAPETSAPPASDTDPAPELPEPVREPDWRLTLVNEANPLPEDYEPDTAEAGQRLSLRHPRRGAAARAAAGRARGGAGPRRDLRLAELGVSGAAI